MLQTDAKALREEAAKATRLRIASDLEKASKMTAPLVKYIAAHLFERSLSYDRLRQACDIRDNNRSTVFGQEFGLTPAAYIRECRFAVASQLLHETSLDVAKVGELVGYKGANVFSAAFRRWAGMTPNAYRRHERKLGEHRELALPEHRPDLSPAAWRRLVEGNLPSEEASRLLRFFLDLYPESRRHFVRQLLRQAQLDDPEAGAPEALPALAPTLRSLFAREDIEQLMAEVVWEGIREKPWQEVEDVVRHHLQFTTSALFYLLGDKYLEESRRDRARGVEIARLALVAAQVVEGDGAAVGGRGPMKALAWGWLGNAKRLALDFAGADEAFVAARQRLPEDAHLEAGTVLSMVATLRLWQRRHEEGLDAADEAIPRLQLAGQSEALPRNYLVRGIIHCELGDFAAAARDNDAAALLLDPEKDSRLFFAARYNRANCLVRAGDPAASEAIVEARRLSAEEPDVHPYLVWLEGLVAGTEQRWETALRKLREAKTSFEQGDDSAVLAVLTLDLAVIQLQAGQVREARERVEKALPLFESLAFRGEALVARLLRDDAQEVAERLAEVLSGGLTSRALRGAQQIATRIASARERLSSGPVGG